MYVKLEKIFQLYYRKFNARIFILKINVINVAVEKKNISDSKKLQLQSVLILETISDYLLPNIMLIPVELVKAECN